MAIYKGTQQIVGLYLGSQEIVKRYKGTQLIFEASKWLANKFTYLYYDLIPQTIDSLNVKDKVRLATIEGNSGVKNQLFKPTNRDYTNNGVRFIGNPDGSWTISGTATGGQANLNPFIQATDGTLVENHYYLLIGGISDNAFLRDTDNNATDKGTGVVYKCTNPTAFTSAFRFRVNEGTAINTTIYPRFVDLTQRYPFDTPTSLTDNRVRKILAEGYQGFNAGTIEDSETSELVAQPFNIWDEQWEVGALSSTTGGKYDGNQQRIRSKNYCRILPNIEYYFLFNIAVCFYDKDKNFITTKYFNPIDPRLYTTPKNAYWFKLYTANDKLPAVYENNICINRSCSLNGTYKPHKQPSTISLPAPLKLGGVGTNHNTFEITKENYVFTRKTFKTDFNTFEYVSGDGVFRKQITNATSDTHYRDFLHSKYNFVILTTLANLNNGDITRSNQWFYIKDTSTTDPSALTGNMEYTLATPQVINIPRKHLACVDLGSLNWNYSTSTNIFYTTDLSSVLKEIGYYATYNLFCELYKNVSGAYFDSNRTSENMMICEYAEQKQIRITNKAYTNATDFKTAMAGVYLWYETESEVADFVNETNIEAGGTLTSYWFSWNKNQKLSNGNFTSTTGWASQGCSFSVNNNEGTFTLTADAQYNTGIGQYISPSQAIVGHKYLLLATIKTATAGLALALRQNNDYKTFTSTTSYQQYAWLHNGTGAGSQYFVVLCQTGTTGEVVNVKDCMCIDLTDGFGSGKEPTALTDPKVQFILKYGYIPTDTTGTLENVDPKELPNVEPLFKCK